MLLNLELLVAQYKLPVDSILHVGAHHGQEAALYERLGATRVTWVEANPAVLAQLQTNVEPYGHRVVAALVSDRSGQIVDFHITNNEQSSSVLKMGTHRYEHPDVLVSEVIQLTTSTLDELCEREAIPDANVLVMDVQGAEMLVLRGAERVVSSVDFILAEVNERPLYAGACLLPAFDSYLDVRGFDRVATELTVHGWGDALYVRRATEVPGASGAQPVGVGQTQKWPVSGSELLRAFRRRVGSKARELIAGVVYPRFDVTDAWLTQLSRRITVIEQMLVRNEVELSGLRQQLLKLRELPVLDSAGEAPAQDS